MGILWRDFLFVIGEGAEKSKLHSNSAMRARMLNCGKLWHAVGLISTTLSTLVLKTLQFLNVLSGFRHAACFATCRKPERTFRRSEEHTSELQSHSDLVCRLLLEKKKEIKVTTISTFQTNY